GVREATMSDPGWDIPGVPRQAPADADVPFDAHSSPSAPASTAYASHASSSGSGSRARRGKSGRKVRDGSVSACAGLSAGAFARLADGGSPAATSLASTSGNGAENLSSTASAAAVITDSRSTDSRGTGSPATAAGSPSARHTSSPGTDF